MIVDPRIIEALELFGGYASHVDDWLIVKKNILRIISPELRKQFSRRHEKTKRQIPNKLEFELMQRWAALTERQVIFTDDGKEEKIDPP